MAIKVTKENFGDLLLKSAQQTLNHARGQSKRVAIVLVRGPGDSVLMGRRKDNELMTQPGGHIEPGESAIDGARRELWEETGLKAKSLKYIKSQMNGALEVHLFEAEVEGELTTENDPDDECFGWFYCDPLKYCSELHIPLRHNILIRHWAGLD